LTKAVGWLDVRERTKLCGSFAMMFCLEPGSARHRPSGEKVRSGSLYRHLRTLWLRQIARNARTQTADQGFAGEISRRFFGPKEGQRSGDSICSEMRRLAKNRLATPLYFLGHSGGSATSGRTSHNPYHQTYHAGFPQRSLYRTGASALVDQVALRP
jgi:hypothetical protein